MHTVNDTLRRCLDDLEERIDPQEEDAILQAWRDFSENRFHGNRFGGNRFGGNRLGGGIFSPQRSRPNPP